MDPFAHLHVASSFSPRYGVSTPAALVGRAAELGMDRLALTDRDGLYGAVKHALACRDAGLGAILGADLTMPAGRRVTVLARGGGWGSLCRLVSAAHAGERGRPSVTREVVAEHARGLTVLVGPASDVGRAVAERRYDDALARLDAWRAAVPDLVVELVDHYGPREEHVAARMLDLAGRLGVPAVLTNAVRYRDPSGAQVADVLDATRKLVPLHTRHLDDGGDHAYLKSGAEMARVAARICGPDHDAARRLLREIRTVSDRCVLDPEQDLGIGRLHLPEIGEDPVPLLRRRCEDGLYARGLERSREARERLAHEMDIIERKRLSGYFIAVAGIADLIRGLGIRCAIRGSGAGSLVNHLIGISQVDPLAHGLLMERFLSEGRVGLPDIDLDVESARRLDAYRAIYERYGEARVACVSMMETYRARSAIRDVGAAMGLPPAEIDAMAKAFPHIRARQIRAALQDLPELRASRLGGAQVETVFRLAESLDGLPRHIALHPCGVLVGNSTLRDRTPVERSLLEFPMSQFDKDDVEELGLLKLDVLGVRMQSAMAYSLREIARVDGVEVDLDAVPHDDSATYDMIQTGRTLGCFQIESPGQRELVSKLVPRTMHDLIVDISLFRPGPVNSDMVTPYLEARHGWRAASYPHPRLRDALAETEGVVVFHEQVLKVIDVMTGCGLSEAEKVRRTLSDPERRGTVRAWFEACALPEYDRETVDRAWHVLDAFGAFGFCKAHAAAFALPTYQSAWLKRHHTAAFFAGVLTHEPGMYPQRVILDDARQCGVEILPLDISKSGKQWRVERTETGGYGLRVPFSEVKGVSEAEVERMVAGQPYTSLADFWQRARPSRPVAERIVSIGGADALYGVRPGRPRWRPGRVTRRDLIAQVGALERALVPGAQMPIGFTETIVPGELPEMSEAEAVEAELAVLGMDVSRHIVSFHDELLDALGVVRSKDLLRQRSGAPILVAGVKVATQTPAVRSGQRVIFATLDDSTGPIDLTFFESVQGRYAATVFGSWLMVARGVVRRTGDRAVSLRAEGCWDLGELDAAWREGGLPAVHALMGTAVEPVARVGGRPIRYANGYRLSPYSDLGPPGRMSGHELAAASAAARRAAPEPLEAVPLGDLSGDDEDRPPRVVRAPRRLWHASQGSSGDVEALGA
ncbi:DNA polymerase III subunit alpha [Bailinhaonella thermotolerans]|uniref:DNA polymerase III subunit alpha n=1 Tax=Bailinhaonella thermotolerans TaxID=1070861 RepID=A0A3A4A960_9ACTN|nr:DNA polymerase III subunit alpha [Bailinhaonella thermotolerans]RJL22814.1 DNA polymerase III subunit alpha [Bailinhaonella thermotolerans]